MSTIVTFSHSGNFKKTRDFLAFIKARKLRAILDAYGGKGCQLLEAATPRRTGATASSWTYEIVMTDEKMGIEWHNSRMADDGKTPVAILIQMGHGTGTGGYVPPTDFINPAMKPLFDELVSEIDKVVKAA